MRKHERSRVRHRQIR
jgi:hypothetical protein